MTTLFRATVLTIVLVPFLGCLNKGGLVSKELKTDAEKYSYSIGYQFGQNLKSQGAEIDAAALAMAVQDVVEGKESKLSEEEMQAAMKKMYEIRRTNWKKEGEENAKAGADFLAQNKEKEGVEVTDSGLQYKVIKEGEGEKPKADDKVVVHYKGTLIDGTEFDSSYKRNRPAEFPVNAVIAGWTEALQMMNVGSKWELIIPAELAYGDRARPNIPPNSVLQFEVELLEIKGDEEDKASK